MARNSKLTNVISMDNQLKVPIKGEENALLLKQAAGNEGVDLYANGLPRQKQYELAVNNSSLKNGTEVTANVGRIDSSVDGIPSASGVSRGPSSAGKFATEGSSEITGKTYNVKGQILTENQFSALRQKAVNQAWKQEKELVETTGRGTRDWSREEIQELLTNGKVKGYEGQHMKSAKENPDFAGDPDNIQFLKGRNMDINEHLDAHGGNYQNPTNGYYDPKTGETIDFGDNVPWK